LANPHPVPNSLALAVRDIRTLSSARTRAPPRSTPAYSKGLPPFSLIRDDGATGCRLLADFFEGHVCLSPSISRPFVRQWKSVAQLEAFSRLQASIQRFTRTLALANSREVIARLAERIDYVITSSLSRLMRSWESLAVVRSRVERRIVRSTIGRAFLEVGAGEGEGDKR
jgi:hypothetical protein